MEYTLTDQERTLLSEVSHIALQHVAYTLGEFLHDEVFLTEYFQTSDKMQELLTCPTQHPSHLFYTEIVGALRGKTFLLIPENAAATFGQRLLKELATHSPEMQREAMLETDNILVAALVTKFANLLNLPHTHGDVPVYASTEPELWANQDNPTGLYSFGAKIKSFQQQVEVHLFVRMGVSLLPYLQNFVREKSHVAPPAKRTEEAKA